MEPNNNLRKKKIVFVRQDVNKAKKLKKVWRKPKGMHSKLRLNKKGHERKPSQGYRGPKALRMQIRYKIVNSLKDIGDEKTIVIASNVGLRKRVELAKKAKKNGLDILNLPDIDKFLSDVEIKFNKKKNEKKSKEEKKQKMKEELKKKEEDKKEDKKKLIETVKPKTYDMTTTDKATKSQNVHRATAPRQK